MSSTNPRTGTALSIQGCARTSASCSRVCRHPVLKGEEIHRRRGRIAGRVAEPGVQFLIGEGGEAAAGVVEEHDLGGTDHAIGGDQFGQHLLGHRRARGPDHVELVMGQAQDCRQVRQAGIHAGDDGDAWPRAVAQRGVGRFRVGAVRLNGLVDHAHVGLHQWWHHRAPRVRLSETRLRSSTFSAWEANRLQPFAEASSGTVQPSAGADSGLYEPIRRNGRRAATRQGVRRDGPSREPADPGRTCKCQPVEWPFIDKVEIQLHLANGTVTAS